MIKKYLAVLVLLILLSQLLPGGLFQTAGVAAQGPDSASKISSLLSLQVNAKLRAVKAGGVPAALEDSRQAGYFDMLQSPGIRLEDLNEQQIFLHFAEEPTLAQIEELEAMGIIPYLDSWIPPLENHPTGFILADMPVDKLEALAEKGYVVRLETAERVLEPQNDLGTQKINVDNVWDLGYDGSGVRIAVLDSGLDVSHADIPTPVDSQDYWNYPDLDTGIANTVTGHGTHVTGSVLGRGTQSGGIYKGSAPGADLIFLKIGNDTTGSATTAAMANAIRDAVDEYHADIITMSYGGWSTYHDGSNEEAQAVDYAVSQGAVVLIAAGNDATADKHYSGTVNASSTTDYIQINVTGAVGNDTPLWFNLVWYDGVANNGLSLQFYDSVPSTIPTVNEAQTESPRGTEARLSYIGASEGFPYAAPNGTYYVKVTNSSGAAQDFHLYVWIAGGGSVTFQNADPNYTIGSPADADSAIAVGAYNTRQTWYNYANIGYWYPDDPVDQISTFSSRGPRVDTGAPPKPNIVAPGSAIISTRDNDVYLWANRSSSSLYIDNDGPNGDNASKNDGNGPADYYVMRGTSMATPLAAGAAALLLQKNPGWTPAQVKQALESTATDKGAAGHDNVYGWGLIDALAAVSISLIVTTNAADSITAISATLHGSLDSLGNYSSADVSFEKGITSGNYPWVVPSGVMTSTGAFTGTADSLSANTTYYFRAKATADNVTVYGSELSFATSALVSINVTPDNPVLLSGRTQQFTATGTYSDNSTADLTTTATWASNNTAVATISATGLATSVTVGTTAITAWLDGITSPGVTLTVAEATTVAVNLGNTITLGVDEVVTGTLDAGIPIDVKGIIVSEGASGLAAFDFTLNWDPAVIQVDSLTGSLAAALGRSFGFTIGAINNSVGSVTFVGTTTSDYSTADLTLAYLGITAVGSTGDSTSINIIITNLTDDELLEITPRTPVNAPVQITSLLAETSISQGLSSNTTGKVVLKVNIDRIKNQSDNSTANITGGIGNYTATASADPSSIIQFLTVYGVSPFDGPSFNATTGVFSVAMVASPIQAANTMVAEVVPILTGNTTTSVNLTIAFNIIGAAGQPGLNVPEEHSNTITLLRGDADKNGVVTVVDSLIIKQYLVGQRTLGELNPLNAACVNHDGAGGDKISVVDALAIEQYLVGQRDAYFE